VPFGKEKFFMFDWGEYGAIRERKVFMFDWEVYGAIWERKIFMFDWEEFGAIPYATDSLEVLF
jgi:hypothetical protein